MGRAVRKWAGASALGVGKYVWAGNLTGILGFKRRTWPALFHLSLSPSPTPHYICTYYSVHTSSFTPYTSNLHLGYPDSLSRTPEPAEHRKSEFKTSSVQPNIQINISPIFPHQPNNGHHVHPHPPRFLACSDRVCGQQGRPGRP